jgi:hypothetical protein
VHATIPIDVACGNGCCIDGSFCAHCIAFAGFPYFGIIKSWGRQAERHTREGNHSKLFYPVCSALRLIHALLRAHHWRSGSAGSNRYLCVPTRPAGFILRARISFGHLPIPSLSLFFSVPCVFRQTTPFKVLGGLCPTCFFLRVPLRHLFHFSLSRE